MGPDRMGMFHETGGETALPLIGVYEISKVLGATLDIEKALHDVLNILSSYLNMRHGAVVLQHPESHELDIVAVSGMSLSLARSGALAYPFPAIAKVISTGQPLVAPDAQSEPLLADYLAAGDGLDDERISFLCVPIRTTAKAFGALSVERSWDAGQRPMLEHDLRFITMVATLIGQSVALHRKVALDRERLMSENVRLQKSVAEARPLSEISGLEDVIGSSEAMARVLAQVQQAAPAKATILLRGESGTGKELIARAVHILSPRARKSFVKVNCAALSETLLESELFGHEKGSFTGATSERKGRFELAAGGTLFLDEIGEISGNFQAKLLRVLQEGEFERVGGTKTIKVDVRLVAATNRDLETAVAKGEFRADLYYRLNVVPIFLPPLRERSGDIPLLAMYFLKRFNEENSRKLSFSDGALAALQRCAFPGNVRELENCVTRAATMCRGQNVGETDLACRKDTCLSSMLWSKRPAAIPVQPPQPAPRPVSTPETVDEAPDDERQRLVQAMEHCGWVQAKAARLLGLTPRQIGYALKKHGIEVRQL